MKIFIICSKAFYEKIPPIKSALEKVGHIITLPNCYDCPEIILHESTTISRDIITTGITIEIILS